MNFSTEVLFLFQDPTENTTMPLAIVFLWKYFIKNRTAKCHLTTHPVNDISDTFIFQREDLKKKKKTS